MVALCDAALKDAGCRLRRWPTAVPDRGVTQRPHEPQAGPRKRQPGRTRKLARKAKMKTSRSKGIDKRRPVTEARLKFRATLTISSRSSGSITRMVVKRF